MGLGDLLRKTKSKFSSAKSKIGNYFSRKPKEEPVQERERPYGNPYEIPSTKFVPPKRSWSQKLLGGAGKLFGHAAFWGFAIGTLGIGPTYLFYKATPENSNWLYTENPDNVWRITQDRFSFPSKVIRPMTTDTLNTIIERDATITDDSGNPISNKVPAADMKKDIIDLDFITKEGYTGKVEGQIIYNVPTEEDAKKAFYTLRQDYKLIHDQVLARIANKINSMTWEDIKRQSKEDSDNYKKWKKGKISEREYLEGNGVAFDDIIKSLHDVREQYGINIKSIAIGDYKLDDLPKEIESQKIKAKKEAEARILRANAERKEAAIQAQTTLENAQTYIQAGEVIADTLRKYGVTDEEIIAKTIIDVARETHYADTIQQSAHASARNIIMHSPIGQSNSQPAMYVNNAPVNTEPLREKPVSTY